MAKRKGGLGRGLDALLGDVYPEQEESSTTSHVKKQTSSETKTPDQQKAASSQEELKDIDPVEGNPILQEMRKEAEERKTQPTIEIDEEAAENATIKEREVTPQQRAARERKVASLKNKRDKAAQRGQEYTGPRVELNEEQKRSTIADIDLVEPNPDQPRINFKKDELEELASSIKQNGLIQPILVRKFGKKYQIIAGERRWQASKRAGLTQIPIRLADADEDKALELAIVENIQRSDLNPIEEAYGYRRLMDHKHLTQSDLARLVGKGRSTIANALRLLELPEEAQKLLFEEKITAGHARAILSIPTEEGRKKLTDKLTEGHVSVREAENLARLYSGKTRTESTKRVPVPQSYKKAARGLRKTLGVPVRVRTVKDKNKIEIEFKDEEDLTRIVSLLENKA